jgi:AraC-like DNA-binding protein
MSRMAYLRVVRLRRAHRDLGRSANPSHSSIASIAHRWGFTHLGRFAAAHQTMFGETPLKPCALHADFANPKRFR